METLEKNMPSYMKKVGKISFIVGITLAVIIGLYVGYMASSINNFFVSILMLLGLIVGLINVTSKETIGFITSVIALFLIKVLGGDFLVSINIFGVYYESILNAMLILFLPALIIVALKAIWDFAADV